jgi:hypothetical protein
MNEPPTISKTLDQLLYERILKLSKLAHTDL